MALGRLALVVVLAGVVLAACGGGKKEAKAGECWSGKPDMASGHMQWNQPPQMVIDPAKSGYVATVETNLGAFKIRLLAKQAPKTVNNFVCLARAGYYDKTPFHRIIEGFMIQGGDPTGTGTGGPGYQFEDELPTQLDYTRGAVAMANAGPNTNGSQFFIVQDNQSGKLQKNYSIFGQVTEGMEVVDKIAAVAVGPSETGEMSVPKEPVTIQKVTITETEPQ
jgi:peptidylprolyl isomerase